MKEDKTQLRPSEMALLQGRAMGLEDYLGDSLLEVRVVDASLKSVPLGDIGRILVRGPGLNLLAEQLRGGEPLPGAWIDLGKEGYVLDCGSTYLAQFGTRVNAAVGERWAVR